MTRPKDPRGSSKHHHRQSADHARSGRNHRKNPCGHAPAPPDNATAEFQKHPGRRRHNRWTMRVKWDEVHADVDGLPVLVQDYKLETYYSAVDEEFTAENLDGSGNWFVDNRFKVPGKDDEDPNDLVHKVVKGIRATLWYGYRVRAIEKNGCKGEWVYVDAGTPTPGPSAPENVAIHRRPHGLLLDWDEPVEADDADILNTDIDHYVAQLFLGPEEDYAFPDWVAVDGDASSNELTATAHGMDDGEVVMFRGGSLPEPIKVGRRYYVRDSTTDTFKIATTSDGSALDLTADGDGEFLEGLYHWKRHLKKSQIRFHVDSDDIDEDQKFYGRVESVDDDKRKSAFIPATQGGNNDPDAAPDGRNPKMVRHVPAFNIPGEWSVGTYNPPNVFEDDYIIRRVLGTADTAPTGGTTIVDVVVNSGSGYDSIFEDDTADMLTYTSGDEQASTKAIHTRRVDRGDRFKIQVEEINGSAPHDGVIKLVCDRLERHD